MALATPGVDAAGQPDPRPARAWPIGQGAYRRGPRRRAHAGQHRPAAPCDPWRAPAGAGARGRDGPALHPPHRLSPLRLREAGRIPAVQPDHPAHRPHRLPVADGQQRLPGACGREADGAGDHRAVQGASGDRLRDEPHHLAPGLAGDHRHRSRRVHSVPLVVPGAGADLQPPGGVDRRPAHHQPHPGRRAHGRYPGWLGSRPPGVHQHLSQDARRNRHHVHPERHLDRADPGRGRAHRGRSDQPLAVGPHAPGQRGGLRCPEGPALPGLRELRLRCPDGRVRRHLRSLPGAAGGDDPVEPDSGTGTRPARPAEGRSDQRRPIRGWCFLPSPGR